MNRKSPGLLISKAMTGFIQSKLAEGLSTKTTDSYKKLLDQWLDFHHDVDLGSVTAQQVRNYLSWTLN